MNQEIIFSLFGPNQIAEQIAQQKSYKFGELTIHSFPDGESLVTVATDVADQEIIFFAYLDRPDAKLLQLIFAAETVRSLGAKRVTLIAPYLPYMRQDKQFHLGEGISSKYFAALISNYFDRLITIDPHLHRWHALSDIYSIPNNVVHAGPTIAAWITKNISNPILLGPDSESAQWVNDIAKKLAVPYIVLTKVRFGDQQVVSDMPEVSDYINHHFVLIDDIVSSAATMIEAIKHLQMQGIKKISCIGVHAIFANDAYEKLLATGVQTIVSCNTVIHPSNQIDLAELISRIL